VRFKDTAERHSGQTINIWGGMMNPAANYISAFRIIISLALLYTKPLHAAFLFIYVVIGLSDIMDGYVARKTCSTSKLGEKLDSIADMVFDGVLIVILYPVVNPGIQILIWIAAIALIRIISAAIVFAKYRIFGMIHTLANKGTGLFLFFFPILYSVDPSEILICTVCIAASISAIEELLIDLMSEEWQANRKSIFVK
jgi:phosphatidylglycerophosphate synthase